MSESSPDPWSIVDDLVDALESIVTALDSRIEARTAEDLQSFARAAIAKANHP